MAKFSAKLQFLITKMVSAFRCLWREPRAFLLFLRMAGWVVLLTLLTKIFSLQRVLQFITVHPAPAKQFIETDKIVSLLDQLLSLNVLAFTPTCWKRAIILHRFLALQGLPTRIVFGVQRDAANKLSGHAWLEFQGQPFLEMQTPQFVPTFSFPG
jgi:Transglutaminase-like superfamily